MSALVRDPRGRSRVYPFGALAPGDRIGIALNRRDATCVRMSVHQSARHYRRRFAPGYAWAIWRDDAFLIFARVADGLKGAALRAARDDALVAFYEDIGRRRALTDIELTRLEATYRRIRARRDTATTLQEV